MCSALFLFTGGENQVAIDLIVLHVHTQLQKVNVNIARSG